jgi:hypothetical protein
VFRLQYAQPPLGSALHLSLRVCPRFDRETRALVVLESALDPLPSPRPANSLSSSLAQHDKPLATRLETSETSEAGEALHAQVG